MSNDATKRFTNRVDNYVKYRPGYPEQTVDYLEKQCHLSPESVIADIGAGTGIFTKLLLERDYTVYAVEPNDAMRHEADRQLKHYPKYHSRNGRAEETGLKSGSIDLIVCAQAFHWFNSPETHAEFKRILKSEGQVALIWNNRDIEADDFAMMYEFLLKDQSSDYERVNHQNLTEMDFVQFFRDGEYHQIKFHNQQVFDREELAGRAFSSSYVPAQESEAGKAFCERLNDLFDSYQNNGKVIFRYNTEVYWGKL
jgi:ubiquinone/menaquinone biosynthesis C-methylase UbiE